MIVVGVLALAAALLLIKAGNKPQAKSADTFGNPPAVQLQNALADNRPTLAFFHSYTCQQCIDMMEIVDQVYPEFSDSIVLVDIDVYDERNETSATNRFCGRWGSSTFPHCSFTIAPGRARSL
jgi:thiol-disulfide isomerase/thioredoxin